MMVRTGLVPLLLLFTASVALAQVEGVPSAGDADETTGSSEATSTEPNADEAELEANTAQQERQIRDLRRRVNQHLVRQRWEDAVRDMKELVILDPYDAEYQLTLGLLYRKQSAHDQARRKYNDFLDLGGSAAVAHLMMAESFAAKGDKPRAFDHLRKAAENGLNVMRAIQRFESMRAYRSDTEFIKLALQLERYELDLRGFKDVFTGRFARTGGNGGTGPRVNEVTDDWDRDKQEQELRRCKLYLANIEHFLSTGNEARAMDAYEKLLGILEHQEKFTVPAFATEIRGVLNRKEDIERGIERVRLKFLYGRARDMIQSMEQSFRGEDYAAVVAAYSDLEVVAKDILSINREFKEVSDRVLATGKNWVERAKVRQEFASMPLKIHGIILHDGPAVAIVNDKQVEEGRYFNDMRVLRIEPNQIMFEYKGEQVPLIFRRY